MTITARAGDAMATHKIRMKASVPRPVVFWDFTNPPVTDKECFSSDFALAEDLTQRANRAVARIDLPAGGAMPADGALVISLVRLNRILELDLPNARVVVEPGVINSHVTARVASDGYFYAPDPSSQRACTIGGNVAENAGGPHTLAYGVTTNHTLGLEAVLADGTVVHTGGIRPDSDAYDLTGLLTGSEGTMALVTKIAVRLMRQPEAVKTLLAIYDRTEDAGDSVTEITARIPVVAAAVGTVVLTLLLGTRLFGRRPGLWAALILLTSVVFFDQALASIPDAPLLFFELLTSRLR